MALTSTLSNEPWGAPDGPATPCFLCGYSLGEGMCAYWVGASSASLHLHIDCVPSFARRILEDWERANGIPVKREAP